MEATETKQYSKEVSIDNSHSHGGSVHHVLAHSYTVYFILFLIAAYLDFVFKIEFLKNYPMVQSAGFIFLVFSTFLILWAQRTSRMLKKDVITKENFCRGPYCYTRTPTHWGLFLLILGFGLMSNAIFISISAIVSFVIVKIAFVGEEERILMEKYGAPYIEYKKSVKF